MEANKKKSYSSCGGVGITSHACAKNNLAGLSESFLIL